MGHKTPLYDEHVAASARMVDFGGWDMPLQYGSQLAEHEAVRSSSGMFDVSHMTVVDVTGAGATEYLRRVVANDVARLTKPGKALYGCLLNDSAGIIDDLIVYFRGADNYRLVVNAATRDKDLAWLAATANDSVTLVERADLAMVAVQGPDARQITAEVLGSADDLLAVRRFGFVEFSDSFIARTGYTGEDGFEIILPSADAAQLWRDLTNAGVAPCGLGARDSLRLEAGLCLYGSDMDETTSPYESNLAWTVDTSDAGRDFIGRTALGDPSAAECFLTGLLLPAGGVLRGGQTVVTDVGKGTITSGSFAPTLKASVALARLPTGTSSAEVIIRKKQLPVQIVNPPFVRAGKATFAQT
ncbi:MAG: glycine cleavage system aminomethyltransferase GcvT [Pseudomonadota bacterium]